jgi:hypothetical protein
LAQKRGDMAGRSWDEIPQESWEDIKLRVDEAGEWHLRFNYIGANGIEYEYPEESISLDDFLDIYDEAAYLDQELEVEAES